jgi:predicted transposase YdaD
MDQKYDEGKIEGKFEGRWETAKNMLKEGANIQFIVKVTGFSKEELMSLKQGK